MRKNILLLGEPRSGKTSLLESLIKSHPSSQGVKTTEVTIGGERSGFIIENHKRESSTLATINGTSEHTVGKYAVYPEVVSSIFTTVSPNETLSLLYVDEVGRMQTMSSAFSEKVISLLNSEVTCVITASPSFSSPLLDEIKERKDVIIVEITKETREVIKDYVAALVTKIEKARVYAKETDRFVRGETTSTIRLFSLHGTRNLRQNPHGEWTCDCTFFHRFTICSHVIAVESYESKA